MVLNYKKRKIKMKLILSIFGAMIICMNIAHAKDLTPPKLKYEMTAKLYLEAPMPIEANQTIFSVVAEGSYIKLSTGETWEVLSPCADWGYISANGTVELDVRCTAKAEDGSFVRIDYKGRANDDVKGKELTLRYSIYNSFLNRYRKSTGNTTYPKRVVYFDGVKGDTTCKKLLKDQTRCNELLSQTKKLPPNMNYKVYGDWCK